MMMLKQRVVPRAELDSRKKIKMKERKSWIEMTPEEFALELESMRYSQTSERADKFAHGMYYAINGILILAGMIALFYRHC